MFGLGRQCEAPIRTGIHFAFPMSGLRTYDNPVDILEIYIADFIENRFESDMVVLGLDISFQIV